MVAARFAPVPLVSGGVSSRCGTLVTEDAAKLREAGFVVRPLYELMSRAPVFGSGFYFKSTGAEPKKPRSFPASERAAEKALLCFA